MKGFSARLRRVPQRSGALQHPARRERRLNRLTYSGSSDALSEAANYDAGGNISNLTRLGTSAATLAYTYRSGNQLGSVTNGGAAFRSYSYDGNGNATTDGGLSAAAKTISYNLLNLPQSISQNGTTLATYTYAADGEKLRNSGSDGYWDYDGGIVYNGTTSSNGTIQFIQTEEGRALPQGNSWNYTYDLKDHLGNVRLSFDKNPSTSAARRIQEDEYYAFGLRSAVYNNLNNNRYLYNGKELQTDLLNQYDYGARFYDPVVGRWTAADPSSERAFSLTPYRYGFNNPISVIDPTGRFETDGHFWTVYLLLTIMNRGNAWEIAHYAELPDNRMNRAGDNIGSTDTWMNPIDQYNVHAITGGATSEARRRGIEMMQNATGPEELGTAIHYFGDSFAHSNMLYPNNMYVPGFGHLMFGHDPDKVANRPELYKSYVKSLNYFLGDKHSKNDLYTFDYIANLKGNTAQNSAVLETEVRIREGIKSFDVEGDNASLIKSYVENSNSHFGRSVQVETSVGAVYEKNENGEWVDSGKKQTYVVIK